MVKSGPDIIEAEEWAGKKIGLLGGSFNPAHEGHLEISLIALKRLELDAVWWLVSPQNPLKSAADMAALGTRMAHARSAADDPRIHVTDLEAHFGSRYTVDTLDNLLTLLPATRFVWLMGADNLAQLPQWKDWKKIIQIVTFAIFDRPGYSSALEESEAAVYLRDSKIPAVQPAKLCSFNPPAWTIIRETENPLSSTEIRRKKL